MNQDGRVYQQDIVPFIRLRQPVLQASSQLVDTVTYSATVLFDLNAANIFTVTLKGAAILSIKNASIGQGCKIRFIQDATGSRTVTWFDVNWAGGSAPTLTTTANHWDVIELLCTGNNTFDGKVWGADFS